MVDVIKVKLGTRGVPNIVGDTAYFYPPECITGDTIVPVTKGASVGMGMEVAKGRYEVPTEIIVGQAKLYADGDDLYADVTMYPPHGIALDLQGDRETYKVLSIGMRSTPKDLPPSVKCAFIAQRVHLIELSQITKEQNV